MPYVNTQDQRATFLIHVHACIFLHYFPSFSILNIYFPSGLYTTGGVREAYFSDEYYNLIWGTRIGFAKIAAEAKVVNKFASLMQYQYSIGTKLN